MDIATIVGFIAASTCLMVGIGENIALFFDIPSLIIVFGGVMSALLISFPLQTIVRIGEHAWLAFLPPEPRADAREVRLLLQEGVTVFRRAKDYASAVGWIGLLIGAVIMLGRIDYTAPDLLVCLARGSGIAVLTVLWGQVLAYLVCLPLQTKLEARLKELDGETPTPLPS